MFKSDVCLFHPTLIPYFEGWWYLWAQSFRSPSLAGRSSSSRAYTSSGIQAVNLNLTLEYTHSVHKKYAEKEVHGRDLLILIQKFIVLTLHLHFFARRAKYF